jgi:hypothetical protein
LTVKNLTVVASDSTLRGGDNNNKAGGWFFAPDVSGAVAMNCKNYGDIATYCGGIFGQGANFSSASRCSNYGAFTNSTLNVQGGGGIFGKSSSNCTAISCTNFADMYNPGTYDPTQFKYVNAVFNYSSGGIFGSDFVNGSATNCINTGAIPYNGGGIFGYNSNSSGTSTASGCINSGRIVGDGAGGIFGPYAGGFTGDSATATNCANFGDMVGSALGGIFGTGAGASYGSPNGNAVANNCFNTGNFIGPIPDGRNKGSIMGIGSHGSISHCYSSTSDSRYGALYLYAAQNSMSVTNSNSTVAWSDVSAAQYLTGIGSTWISNGTNVPLRLPWQQPVTITVTALPPVTLTDISYNSGGIANINLSNGVANTSYNLSTAVSSSSGTPFTFALDISSNYGYIKVDKKTLVITDPTAPSTEPIVVRCKTVPTGNYSNGEITLKLYTFPT